MDSPEILSLVTTHTSVCLNCILSSSEVHDLFLFPNGVSLHSFPRVYDESVGKLLSALNGKQTHGPCTVYPWQFHCTDIKNNSILPEAITRWFRNNSWVTPDCVLQFSLIFMLINNLSLFGFFLFLFSLWTCWYRQVLGFPEWLMLGSVGLPSWQSRCISRVEPLGIVCPMLHLFY